MNVFSKMWCQYLYQMFMKVTGHRHVWTSVAWKSYTSIAPN